MIGSLADFILHNDMLQELDLSYAGLLLHQLIQIFEALHGAHALSFLNLAFNTNEYERQADLTA